MEIKEAQEKVKEAEAEIASILEKLQSELGVNLSLVHCGNYFEKEGDTGRQWSVNISVYI